MLLDSDINFNFKEDGWSVYMNGEKIKHVNSQKIHKKINVFDIYTGGFSMSPLYLFTIAQSSWILTIA